MAGLDGGRIGIAAQAVGLARGALEKAGAYALERRQFGRPIAEFQMVRFALARARADVDAARLLTLRAAWLRDQGQPFTREASEAKLFATEMAQRATRTAVQTLGGYGYMRECAVEPPGAIRGVPPRSRRKKEWLEQMYGPAVARAKERKERFSTLSDMPIDPLDTAEDVRADPADALGFPGEFPYTRGVQASMYRGRLWTMRQFAGFGSPEDTNRR